MIIQKTNPLNLIPEKELPYSSSTVMQVLLCKHCATPLAQRRASSTSEFCCGGCETAFQFIHQLGLEAYYNIPQRDNQAVGDVVQNFSDWDDPEWHQQFITPGLYPYAQMQVSGMRCFACTWLCKQAIEIQFPETEVEVNLQEEKLKISFKEDHPPAFGKVAEVLSNLGYRISPWKKDRTEAWKIDLIRIAVAGFCFMNIMSLAFAEYVAPGGKIDPGFQMLFRWIQLLLCSATLSFSAKEFFRNSILAVKAKKLTIDQPIALALVAAFTFSSVNTILDQGNIYFDSVSSIIFLLLVGRYLQKRVMQRAHDTIFSQTMNMDYVRLITQDTERLIKLTDLVPEDLFAAYPGEYIAVNSILVSPACEVSYESMSGEATPHTILSGQAIFAGASCLGTKALFKARQAGADSSLSKARTTVSNLLAVKGRLTQTSERLASILTTSIIIISSAGILFFWSGLDFGDRLERLVAILLVACPCAFGFASPLAFAAGARRAAKGGVLFRSQKAVEDASRARIVVFDKTGTLTTGKLKICNMQYHEQNLVTAGLNKAYLLALCANIDRLSQHHAAKAIAQWAKKEVTNQSIDWHSFPVEGQEIFGRGLLLNCGEVELFLGRSPLDRRDNDHHANSELESKTHLYNGEQALISFSFIDPLFEDACETIQQFRNHEFDIRILSGDSLQRTRAVASVLGLHDHQIMGALSPHEKLSNLNFHLRDNKPVLMVGNGFNDCMAMAKATVSVAVEGSSSSVCEAADIVLTRPGVIQIFTAWQEARKITTCIVACLGFSLAYNIAAVTLAFNGYITPLVAAILMPINSFILSLIATGAPSFSKSSIPIQEYNSAGAAQ